MALLKDRIRPISTSIPVRFPPALRKVLSIYAIIVQMHSTLLHAGNPGGGLAWATGMCAPALHRSGDILVADVKPPASAAFPFTRPVKWSAPPAEGFKGDKNVAPPHAPCGSRVNFKCAPDEISGFATRRGQKNLGGDAGSHDRNLRNTWKWDSVQAGTRESAHVQ